MGKNVQKDHVITQKEGQIIHTDAEGKVHNNPRKEPAVIVDTGKATPTSEALPHTKKTFHDIEADVKRIERAKKEGIKSISDLVHSASGAAKRSGYKPESVDKAVWGQLISIFILKFYIQFLYRKTQCSVLVNFQLFLYFVYWQDTRM